MPILKLINSLRRNREPVTIMFGLLIFLVAITIVLKVFIPSHRVNQMKQFHLRDASFTRWALNQIVPSMYNYANELWYSYQPLEIKDFDPNQWAFRSVLYRWYNHYPPRIITFTTERQYIVADQQPKYIFMRSRFRNSQVLSALRIDVQENWIKVSPWGEVRSHE